MVSRGHALARDELIRALTAYTGITTADGLGDGTTLVDTNLIDNPFISPSGIPEKTILIISGDARGEDKGAASFNNANGTITLQGTGFSAQIKAGTIYRILNISTVEIDVANINTKIGTNIDAAGTTTLFAWLAKLFAAGAEIPEWGTPTTGTHTTTGTTEETILELTLTDPYQLWMYIDLVNMVALDDFTFRVYLKVDGTNYRLKDKQQLVGVQTIKIYEINGLYGDTACDIKVTVQRASGTDRAFPYRYNVLKEP